MVIRINEVREMLKSYKRDGYLNIFIVGREGLGKTTFGTQLLDLICKEIRIRKHIDMVYYDYNKFKESNFDVRYFADNIMRVEFMPNKLEEIKENLLDKINIFEIFTDSHLNDLDMYYYQFKILDRGVYEFDDKKGKFSNKDIFNPKKLEIKRQKELESNLNSKYEDLEFKDFSKRIRRERHIRTLVLPNMSDTEIERMLITHRFQLFFGGQEGRGKSTLALEMYNAFNNIKKPKRNMKKIRDLIFLYMIYCIALGLLIGVLGVFSWFLYVIVYGIGCVIGWEVFVKPLWKEATR